MAWEENPRICLHMQLIAILSRTGVDIISLWQSSSKLAMLIAYRKCSKSSLLYINQCLKFGSKVKPFKTEP